jgi:hypothetical protein
MSLITADDVDLDMDNDLNIMEEEEDIPDDKTNVSDADD